MVDSKPHHPIIRRRNGRTERRTDIFPVMRVPWLAIHDSDTTEDPRSFAAHRLHETRLP